MPPIQKWVDYDSVKVVHPSTQAQFVHITITKGLLDTLCVIVVPCLLGHFFQAGELNVKFLEEQASGQYRLEYGGFRKP